MTTRGDSLGTQHIAGRPPTAPVPKALIHKKILDAAAAQPEAPMATIADEISGASIDLVERILDEYGDPADAATGVGEPTTEGEPMTESEPQPTPTNRMDEPANRPDEPPDELDGLTDESERPPDESDGPADAPLTPDAAHGPEDDRHRHTADPQLTEVQRETLRAIAEHPTATQRELGELLGVSGASISNRVNAIEGFAWNRREEFATHMFDDGNPNGTEPEPTAEPDSEEMADPADDRIDRLDERLERFDAQARRLVDRLDALDRRFDDPSVPAPLTDPELVHKLVHACVESDRISEEEELHILRALLSRPDAPADRPAAGD